MDLLNYDDEVTCPVCNGVGMVKKNNIAPAGEIGKKVSDLTIAELESLLKNLAVECFEMLKQRELDTSMKEYEKITLNDISTKDGIPIPKEW